MVAGWGNAVGGLLLRRYRKNSPPVVIAIVYVCLQAVGLSAWTFRRQRKRAEYTPKPSWAKVEGDGFALSASDDEDEDDDDDNDNDGARVEDEANKSSRLRDYHSQSLNKK